MDDFKQQLASYKDNIDFAVKAHSESMLEETILNFGKQPTEAVKAYCDLLSRGGKRIRGILAMTGYYMFGGKDDHVALEAAKAVEMLQAYILMVDDIQDDSDVRRGGPSAHVMLSNLHEKQGLKGSAQHFGESIAINGFLFGVHSALNVLADLEVAADKKLAAIKSVNKYFISTAHGQTLDIFNEAVGIQDEELVNKVLVWKTAFYSILSPLQLGGILAGANEQDLESLKPFALELGRAFQITDDIIGIFGEDAVTGKSAMDDIREGKRTILSVRALNSADDEDTDFLEQMLGNKDLSEEEFIRCKKIIEQTGALEYAKSEAEKSTKQALKEIVLLSEQHNSGSVEFLIDLTKYLSNRPA